MRYRNTKYLKYIKVGFHAQEIFITFEIKLIQITHGYYKTLSSFTTNKTR